MIRAADEIVVQVSDNGVGIDEAEREKVVRLPAVPEVAAAASSQ